MKEMLDDAQRRMDGAVKSLNHEMASVRTGRASIALLDRVQVDAYGVKTPLNQLAQLGAPEPRMLTIQPYDRSQSGAIEKAILESDLGLTPTNDGQMIRINIPQLTEQRRKELVKLVHKMAEDARIAVRNVRRDANEVLKTLQKNGKITEDDRDQSLDEVQKLTDAHIKKMDDMLAAKEKEVMAV